MSGFARWLSTVAALVMAALVAAACSSTDPGRRIGNRARPTSTTVDPSVQGAGDNEAPSAEASADSSRPSKTRGATSAGRRGPGQSGGGVPGAAQPGASAALGPPGPGISPTELKIGFWFINTAAACSATGAPACKNDDRPVIEAVVRYVNNRGGIAGRKVVAVIHEGQLAESTYSAEAQTACTKFSQDNRVFVAVAENQAGRPDFAHCLAQRGVPVIDPGYWAFDERAQRELDGFLYMPDRPRPERWVAAYVDALFEQGFLTPASKVGLFRFDAPEYARVTEAVIGPKLAARGVKLLEEAVIRAPDSVGAYGDTNAQIANAILRFRSVGVDRVLFFATLAETQFFWFQQAESQSYRPRYGVSSMEWLDFMGGVVPPAQLRGAVGIGWDPYHDVAASRDPGGGPTAAVCKEMMKGGGVEPGAGRDTKCDSVLFVKAALERAAALNAKGLRLAVEGLGDAFQPAATFSARFGPGRYDGPSSFRWVAYDNACSCFNYTGPLRPFP